MLCCSKMAETCSAIRVDAAGNMGIVGSKDRGYSHDTLQWGPGSAPCGRRRCRVGRCGWRIELGEAPGPYLRVVGKGTEVSRLERC